MKKNITYLTNLPGYDVYLVDQDGYFIATPFSKYDWSRYLDKNVTLQNVLHININQLKIFSKKQNKKKKIHIKSFNGKYGNPLYLVYLENKKVAKNTNTFILKRVFFTLLFVILIAIISAYFISSPISSIVKDLQIKSNQLALIANNLEEKVNQEIQKSAHKDRLLENSSKLAALGEMIGNIAHQWRHPLTRLSLIMQNLHSMQKDGSLDSLIFDKYTKSALEQIDYMSDTIDDFRNFYKDDQEKSYFEPNFAIQRAIKIVDASIKHEGINIKICQLNSCKIYGYPNRFAHVILNLLNNSKEALEQTKTQKPFIRIHVNCEDKMCVVSIEDNAKGMSEKVLKNIFKPRFTTKTNGSGIGLYMSKMIIEESFNGTIQAQNTKEGALFSIKIPYSFYM